MVLLPRTGQCWVINVNGEDWKFDPAGRLLDRPDPDPYDPCWCGSGKKFRFCHRDKQREPRVSNAQFLQDWEASADIEMCLHPTAPLGCSSVIVKAHTLQRMGGGLRSIAESGEVYGYKPHPHFFQKNDLRLVKPERIGTRKASTFRGFCEAHDSPLFKAAEDAEFMATQEQLCLLNFRAVARRVYKMQVTVRHAKIMITYDRSLPPLVQREWFAIHHRELVNAAEALGNISRLKSNYDARVLAANWAETNGMVTYFTGTPDFQCAEIVAMTFDFTGERLHEPPTPAHLCAYTVAVRGGWVFVLSWTGVNTVAEQLCASFLARPDAEKGGAILRYAVEHTDNIFFAPAWWDQLADSQQTIVAQAFTARLHPHYLRDPAVLLNKTFPPLRSSYTSARKIGSWSTAG